MRSTLCALMVVALIAFASTAGAYDFLYSGERAGTHDAGSFGLDIGMWYFMADKTYDSEGESVDLEYDWTAMYFPVNVYYAVADQFEIGVKPNYQSLKAETEEARAEYSGSGLGDTWVYGKMMFMPEPMLTARVGVKVATGDSEPDVDEIGTGSGQMDVDGALLFGVYAGPGTFDGAAGYRLRMENSDTKWKPGNEIHVRGCYSYPMSEAVALKLAADGFFGSDGEWNGTAMDSTGVKVLFANAGIDYTLESGMTLGADFHYPILGTNVIQEWGFGVHVGWGK